MHPIYTVGHGARPLNEFEDVLTEADIRLLIDVRRFPGSRRHPHFAREALNRSLQKLKIDYEWLGESLGGRREPVPNSKHPSLRNGSFRAYADHMESPEFMRALNELQGKARKERIAIMCAETLWWKCHRRLIADALVAGGSEVIHLGTGEDKSHVITPEARLEGGKLVYDAAATKPGNERLF